MPGGGKGLDGLVQCLCPGGDIALPPVAFMGDDRVGETMLPMVLVILVGIAAAGLGRMQQGQAKDIVGGLVPAVFAVIEDGDAVGTVGFGQICPLLGIYLILFRRVVRPLDGTGSNVIAGHGVGDGDRELGLEQRAGSVPVDFVDDVDTLLFIGAVIQADVLREMRVSEGSFHFQRGNHRTVLGHGDPDIPVHVHRSAVHGFLQDFPGRPLEGFVLREQGQADGLPIRNKLPAIPLVDQGTDIPVAVETQAVDGILDGGGPRLQVRAARGGLALAEVEDRVSDGRNLGHEGKFAVGEPLRADRPAAGVENPAVDSIDGHHFSARSAGRIVKHDRSPGNPRVQAGCHRSNGGLHDVTELAQRNHFVVPGELVGARDAGSGKVVMELMPEETAPRLVQAGLWIGDPAQPVGGRGAALGGVCELFIQPVEAFHGGLRGVASGPMDIHRQFLVPYGEFRMGAVRQEVPEQLVGCGAENPDVSSFPSALPVDGGLYRGNRFNGGRSSRVAGAIIMIGNVVWIECRMSRKFGGVCQVFRVKTRPVAQGIGGHHDLVAVQCAPKAEFERNFAVRAGQVPPSPLKFLRGEADEAAVRGYRGKMEPETETVGEKDIGADGAELFLVEMLPEQDVARKRFRGGNVCVRCLPAAAGNVPSSLGDGLTQALECVRMVFLHPGIFDAGLAIEHIVGILVNQRQIAEKGLGDVL